MFLHFLFFAALNQTGTDFFNFDNCTNPTAFPLHDELSKNKSYTFEDLAKDFSALRSNFSADTYWQRRLRDDSWTTKDDSPLATQPTFAKDNSTRAANHVVGTEKINAVRKFTGRILRNLLMDIAFPNISLIEEEFQPNSTNHNHFDTFWQRSRREDSWTTKDDSSIASQPMTAKDNSTLSARPSTAKHNSTLAARSSTAKDNSTLSNWPSTAKDNLTPAALPSTAKDNLTPAARPSTAKDNSTVAARPSNTEYVGSTEKINAVQKITGDIVRNLFMDIAFPHSLYRIEEKFQPNSTNRNSSFFELPFP